MKTRLIWGNLVSGNIERTHKFYTDLGYKVNGEYKPGEAVSFFFGRNDFIINFFTPARLSLPMNGSLLLPVAGNEIIFSLSADSKEEVDKWLEKVKAANGTIFSLPQHFEKGYTFAFSDPDGHKFNVLYWQGM